MAAIAEMYGVEGEMQLKVTGGEPVGQWFQVSSAAKYTLYRVQELLRRWPQHLLRTHVIQIPPRTSVSVIMRYGMREAQATVPPDMTRGQMIEQLVQQFRVGGGEWAVDVDNAERISQEEFVIAEGWRYTLEQVRRPTVRVVMKHGTQERVTEVPEGTTEEGMKQLLISGFGEDIKKSWRVITRTQTNREDPYELKRNRTYELRERVSTAPPESFRVMANTLFNGLRDDIEIETVWSEGQMHEACRNAWANELHGSPSTKLVTTDDRGRRVPYEAQEGWNYELRVRPQTPKWVMEEKMTKGHAPVHPNELVMIGLQLEDGPRYERKVKRGLGEHGLKVLAWELFDWPTGPLHVHIVSSRGEMEFAFRIEPQWTYILRAQPLKIIRKEQPERLNVEPERPPKSKEPARVKGQLTLGLGAKRHITGWCGTKTQELAVSEQTTKGDLIDTDRKSVV
jgi:hypothetical protein